MRKNGWEKLLCPYFEEVCIRILGECLQKKGFSHRSTRIGGVRFAQGTVFFEVSYDPEKFPQYVPTIIIGKANGLAVGKENVSAVPAWYLLPASTVQRQYSSWRFADEKQLENVLKRILNQIILPFLEPLWENVEQLESKIKDFGKEHKLI